MEPAKENPYSYLTAKERTRLSPPARLLLERGLLKGTVLDFGCGYGKDVHVLQEKGVSITGYDPHYSPAFPAQKFETILCIDVLNVLLPEEQAGVLMDIAWLLKPGGKAYFAVRRDAPATGYRSHKVHRLPVYQSNVRLPYASLFCSERWELYEYWHYTWLHRGNAQVCPFLAGEELLELIVETTPAFAVYAPDPVTPGHALIIPKRLTAGYFDLTPQEQNACWMMVNRVQQLLQQRYQQAGFQITVKAGAAAGQTMEQVCIELVPQYAK